MSLNTCSLTHHTHLALFRPTYGAFTHSSLLLPLSHHAVIHFPSLPHPPSLTSLSLPATFCPSLPFDKHLLVLLQLPPHPGDGGECARAGALSFKWLKRGYVTGETVRDLTLLSLEDGIKRINQQTRPSLARGEGGDSQLSSRGRRMMIEGEREGGHPNGCVVRRGGGVVWCGWGVGHPEGEWGGGRWKVAPLPRRAAASGWSVPSNRAAAGGALQRPV